tara:strand:+ start:1431 stop:1550 length:120 start_codon:yes stop_codon:yes gene_type:complete
MEVAGLFPVEPDAGSTTALKELAGESFGIAITYKPPQLK